MLLKGLEETGEFKKDSSFVFRESMLDEFQDINEIKNIKKYYSNMEAIASDCLLAICLASS